MAPLKATCRDCGTEIRGQDLSQIGDLMIAHHRQGRLEGSWTSGACGIFNVKEINAEGEVVKQEWLESTMDVVVKPWTGRLVYDPREKPRGKERR